MSNDQRDIKAGYSTWRLLRWTLVVGLPLCPGLIRFEMKRSFTYLIAICLSILISVSSPDQTWAWVGLELDGKFTGIADPYGATGSEGNGSLWEFSARIMYQESFNSIDTEIHWLGQTVHSTDDITLLPRSTSPFRSLDLETVHRQNDETIIFSEMDRLSLAWSSPKLGLTVGRQAVSWGEAFYFNIGDVFGAFPVTETNRRYKPGIDAVTATVNLGPFSDLSLVSVPVEDKSDNVAAHLLFPFGPGTFSLTGGRILEDDKAGAGYTVDIAGTQVYGTLLLTGTSDGEEYSQTVVGAERQVGPNTFLIGELYRNGWSTGDPSDYPSMILTDEFTSGSVLTLGRYNLAFQVSQQVSPLVSLTPAIFANLSDSSVLLRMDGALSLSDFTDMTGGLFIGLGERPDTGIPQSEYGGIPISLYVEIVHNI